MNKFFVLCGALALSSSAAFAAVSPALVAQQAEFVENYGALSAGLIAVIGVFAVVALIRKAAKKGVGSI